VRASHRKTSAEKKTAMPLDVLIVSLVDGEERCSRSPPQRLGAHRQGLPQKIFK